MLKKISFIAFYALFYAFLSNCSGAQTFSSVAPTLRTYSPYPQDPNYVLEANFQALPKNLESSPASSYFTAESPESPSFDVKSDSSESSEHTQPKTHKQRHKAANQAARRRRAAQSAAKRAAMATSKEAASTVPNFTAELTGSPTSPTTPAKLSESPLTMAYRRKGKRSLEAIKRRAGIRSEQYKSAKEWTEEK